MTSENPTCFEKSVLSRAAIVEPLTTTPVSSAVGLWGSDDLRFLDGLRGLAALYVMIGHARWLLWEGYSEGYLQHPDSYSQAGKALVYFFSIFRYGREAVLFFFVLSGFVIHLRYARKLKAEVGSPSRFMPDEAPATRM